MIARFPDTKDRVFSNLSLIFPTMPAKEKVRILKGCVDNFGRCFAENYSFESFTKRVALSEPQGAGVGAIKRAQDEGRAVILVSGHFGNYEAARISLIRAGFRVGGLYRPMNNQYFNRHYVKSLERVGKPVFAKEPKGIRGLIGFIKSGGVAVFLNDQYTHLGEDLRFMGVAARTSVSVAQISLKYGAPLVPFYGIRRANGIDFDNVFEAPIESSDPIKMTQSLNNSLEARVRANPEQWLWLHRRWKDSY